MLHITSQVYDNLADKFDSQVGGNTYFNGLIELEYATITLMLRMMVQIIEDRDNDALYFIFNNIRCVTCDEAKEIDNDFNLNTFKQHLTDYYPTLKN